MKYKLVTNVRDNERLRQSFNELTQKIYYFNFVNWYEKGFWGDKYIPHVLLDGDKVVSNISVNLMRFVVNGQVKNYIQLGTVMTDPAYRNQGLSRYIMEYILDEYREKADGIYLFGNDSVLEFYPKFGFCPIHEYEYSLNLNKDSLSTTEKNLIKYQMEKLNLSDKSMEDKLYRDILEYETSNRKHNPNENLAMYDNIGLYQFWLASDYRDNVYYLPEEGAYILAFIESGILQVDQIISKQQIELPRLAVSFNEIPSKVKLGFTPAFPERYDVALHKVEDCTLFILGESLKKVESDRMMFPVISHA